MTGQQYLSYAAPLDLRIHFEFTFVAIYRPGYERALNTSTKKILANLDGAVVSDERRRALARAEPIADAVTLSRTRVGTLGASYVFRHVRIVVLMTPTGLKKKRISRDLTLRPYAAAFASQKQHVLLHVTVLEGFANLRVGMSICTAEGSPGSSESRPPHG